MGSPNVILISIDTLRADVAYSGKFPNLNKFFDNSTRFLNAMSSAPLTPVSHATVFTGMQPYNHGIRHLFREKLGESAEPIAQRFRSAGYMTGAIVSCPGMNRWYGFDRGFEHYDDEIPLLSDGSNPLLTIDVRKRGTALKRANLVVDRAIKWLDSVQESPFFGFFHFFDAHWPYTAPKIYAGDNVYEHEVGYADYHLGMLFAHLKEIGKFENSIIMCFSDHGEDLNGLYPNDKGGEGGEYPEEDGHGCLLFEQTQRVLLAVMGPGIPKGLSVDQQVRLVDIFPTLCELANIDIADRKLDGVSLLPAINGIDLGLVGYSETFYPEEIRQRFPYAEAKKSLRMNNETKIIQHLGSELSYFYDLKVDPNELVRSVLRKPQK